ncbi:uncharacterized protein LOC112562025 [Pomacea canaliculata]|uniref:uncharacterized protein LOC112562025 n=1 Tax=Pomacea canaliculata TaxID=400727 RepID=UPI000D733F71|nr:uncharacterized protein LOC112562025 [Pomacea canaliculata]XP_025090770.1 uncharacterized protein LOC112562025 [Pomacea canaliculata]
MARLAAAAWLLLVCVSTTHAGGLQFPLTSGNELWSSIVGKRTDKSGCNGCQLSNMVTHCPLDVVFLLDGSDSIPPLAYQKAVDYVIKEIETVTSLFPGSDVGVLIFSKVVEKEFELRQRSQSDLNQLYQSIRATKQPRKGSLLTDVMREARRLLERYDAAPLVLGSKRGKMIVLVSDGCLDGVEATLDEGRLSAKQGIYILSVATSQAYMSLLTALSVQVLEQRTAIDWRSIVACPTKVLPPVPASSACDDFVLVMDGSDSVRSWEGVMRDYMAVTSLRFQNVDNSIGVIVFGTNVTAQSSDTMLPLLKNKVRLAEMIENKLRFPHSGGTGTTAAIQRRSVAKQHLQHTPQDHHHRHRRPRPQPHQRT